MAQNTMATPDLTPERYGDDQDAADEALISRLISGEDTDLNNLFTESHAHEEEKAEDAVDYEDIEDDDLPDEEPSESAVKREDDDDDFMKGLMDEGAPEGGDHDADGDAIMDGDLFGEDEDMGGTVEPDDVDMFGTRQITPPPTEQDIKMEQTSPYGRSVQLGIPDGAYHGGMEYSVEQPKTREQCIQEAMELFPGFAPNKRLRFNQMLPSKTSKYVQKLTREPKCLLPSKPGLAFGPDTEKFYRSSTIAAPPGIGEGRSIIQIQLETEAAESVEEEEESEDEEDEKKLQQDIQMVCQDWDNIPEEEPIETVKNINIGAEGRPSKVRKKKSWPRNGC